ACKLGCGPMPMMCSPRIHTSATWSRFCDGSMTRPLMMRKVVIRAFYASHGDGARRICESLTLRRRRILADDIIPLRPDIGWTFLPFGGDRNVHPTGGEMTSCLCTHGQAG